MKTYQLWYYGTHSRQWFRSSHHPHTFDTLEEAQVEMVKRIFNNDRQYKIVESEEQQS